jgi:predicted secreted acid phosphatase
MKVKFSIDETQQTEDLDSTLLKNTQSPYTNIQESETSSNHGYLHSRHASAVSITQQDSDYQSLNSSTIKVSSKLSASMKLTDRMRVL